MHGQFHRWHWNHVIFDFTLIPFKVALDKTKELVIDLLTVVGQADIALTQAREAALHPQLDKGFVAGLKMLNKTRGNDSSRFEANQLFHEQLDMVVTRRSKEFKLAKVLATSAQGYTTQGKSRWSKEGYRWFMILNIFIQPVQCHLFTSMLQVWWTR